MTNKGWKQLYLSSDYQKYQSDLLQSFRYSNKEKIDALTMDEDTFNAHQINAHIYKISCDLNSKYVADINIVLEKCWIAYNQEAYGMMEDNETDLFQSNTESCSETRKIILNHSCMTWNTVSHAGFSMQLILMQ